MGRVKISVVIPARWRGNRDRQRAPVPECSTCEPQENEHRAILFFVFFPFFRLLIPISSAPWATKSARSAWRATFRRDSSPWLLHKRDAKTPVLTGQPAGYVLTLGCINHAAQMKVDGIQMWVLVLLFLQGEAASAPGNTLSETVRGRDGSVMVLVQAGSFIMGSAEVEDETPPHEVNLPAFYIDRTEVTVAQYARFVKETGVKPPPDWVGGVPPAGRDDMPITNVSWFDAMRYAVWAGKRLPTEAEWEKAARGTDGRRFPWGNIDDERLRNLGTDKIASTSRGLEERLKGVSRYGCLDMAGNVWEWTADWYNGYPGTSFNSVHFGRQYKVIRGGGAIYFYGTANKGTCTQRARMVPYGAYDGLGFRCVQDVDLTKRPYDPQTLLEEAQNQFKTIPGNPAKLTYEVEFDQMRLARRVPVAVAGQPGQKGHVRAGFPLPKGTVGNESEIRILGPGGNPVASMATPLSKWDDGSIRWVLLDFGGEAGQVYEVDFSGRLGTGHVQGGLLRIDRTDNKATMHTDKIDLAASSEGLIDRIRFGQSDLGPGKLTIEMQVTLDGKPATLFAMPARQLEIEETGPLHGCLRMEGFFGTAEGKQTAMKYDLRVQAATGLQRVTLMLTIVHWADRNRSQNRDEPYSDPAPVIVVKGLSVQFALSPEPAVVVFGTDKDAFVLDGAAELRQPDDLHYVVTQKGKPVANGTRAPGWVAVKRGDNWCVLGVRHFWQNYPRALFVTPAAIGVRLYAGDQPFDWEAGLAKTHEIILDFLPAGHDPSPPRVVLDPLRLTIPPSWACGTEAVGAVLPRRIEALRNFPYWECWREADMRDYVNQMPFGMRDFGDGYMGGPYKGKNAYQNLEYDVPFNYLLEFLRTGDPWYINVAEPMARHQTDIDVNNFSGMVWKHSPLHTTTEADLGHVFLRGVLLHYLLTGEKRQLEMARKVGDFIVAKLGRERDSVIGNERQIGWSLYLLTGLYEVTRDGKYLSACESLCNSLLKGQAPTGKFAIRWDNRIAFFNGIAMNGMLSVHDNTTNSMLATGILRVANRTLGFYPEYACRTLNAFSWALERTGDPRYLDALERCWWSSIEFLHNRNVATEATHMWRFPRFAASYGLFCMFDEGTVLPEPSSWKATRFKSPEVEVFLHVADRPAPVLVIREGLAEGNCTLYDAAGKVVQHVSLADVGKYFEPAVLNLPAKGGLFRLCLTSGKAFGWQIHRDRSTRMTVVDATGHQLGQLLPRAVGFASEGGREVKIRFEAVGEGFHAATLYDPAGRPVATVRHFIDFQDPGRYELELKAAISGSTRGWSLEMCNLKVLSIDGLLPYWADQEAELFNPERF